MTTSSRHLKKVGPPNTPTLSLAAIGILRRPVYSQRRGRPGVLSPSDDTMTISSYVRKTSALAGMLLSMAGAFAIWGTHVSAQQQKSVGRGWPVTMATPYSGYPEDSLVGAVTPWYYTSNPTATGGKAPAGVQPLPRDIFTSKDFYVDRDLWMDKRYYRCNSPIALDSSRTSTSTVGLPRESRTWRP